MDAMEDFGFFESWFVWRDAMAVALVSAGVLAYLGVWVALKRVLFVPMALAQVASCGLILSAFFGFWIGHEGHLSGHREWGTYEALGLSIVSAALLGIWLSMPREKSSESVVSAYLVASAGVLLVGNLIKQELHEVESVLFGSAVLVDVEQVGIVSFAALTVLTVHRFFYKRFLFVAFDRDAAGAAGVPVFQTEAMLMVSFAVMIAVTTQAIGALPAFGLMVLPALLGLRLGRTMVQAFAISVVAGVVSAGFGYYLSFRYDTPTGATMVGLSASLYGMGLALPERG